jgi:hypothetical protein
MKLVSVVSEITGLSRVNPRASPLQIRYDPVKHMRQFAYQCRDSPTSGAHLVAYSRIWPPDGGKLSARSGDDYSVGSHVVTCTEVDIHLFIRSTLPRELAIGINCARIGAPRITTLTA